MTQGRALRASIVGPQLDFPNFDHNGKIEQFFQFESIPQQTVRAPADPRYLEKIIFRGEFNAVEYEFLGTLFSPFFQNLRSIFLWKNFVLNGIRCGSLRAFRWYLGIQNRHYGRLANLFYV